jgi:DNA-binding winged helix-turn-helix (wHTH) protein/Tol biopolymer transport system component
MKGPSPSGTVSSFEFGPFHLDPAERLLTRDGQPVPLTPKAFDLLVYLVEHHGRLVEKSTLMSALWPNTIVEEANLAFQISALRKALGDGDNGESLIQTVPTRGYRFVAVVTTITPPVPARPSAPEPPAIAAFDEGEAIVKPRNRTRRTAVIAAASAVALATAIATIVWWRRPTSTMSAALPAREPVLTRLTANPSEQAVTSARISPDGRMLAYADPVGIHVQFIDTGETQLLPDTRDMEVYAWTADSTKVRAASCDTETCVGWDIGIVGGGRQQSGAGWPALAAIAATPDGSRLAMQVNDGQLSVDLVNGTPPRLILQSAGFIESFKWSLDGRRIIFVDDSSSPSVVKAVSIDGGLPLTVWTAPQGQRIGEALEVASHRLILVIGHPGLPSRGTWEVSLQTLDTNGNGVAVGTPRVLVGRRQDHIEQLSASADGSRVAMVAGGSQTRTYVANFDLRSGQIDEPRRLTNDEWDVWATAWTPDSSLVLMTSNKNDAGDIFSQRPGTTDQKPVVLSPGQQFRPEVSGDGRWIFYEDRNPAAGQRVMRVPIAGGTPEPVATLLSGGGEGARCSLNSRCVIEEWDGTQVLVSELDPLQGRGRQLGRWGPLFGFCLTSEGDEAAFIPPERDTIRVVSLDGKQSRDIRVDGVKGLVNLDPLPGRAGFLSATERMGHARALVLIRSDGTSRILWAPTNLFPNGAIASRDGTHLAIWVEAPHSNAWMLSGF